MGCPRNNSTSSVALHTSSLSPNSFFLSLTSTSVRNPLRPFRALLDSGSSHSFVNEAFATNNRLKFSHLPNPIPLKMFDGSTPSNVSKKVQMPISFSTGETHHLEFFITNLDENYSLVLGYDWLARHNPNIDWMETKITFREPKNPKKELASGRKIDIHMVSTITMTKLCKDPGTSTFVISMTNLNLLQVTSTEILDSILAEYHKFHNIFSGEKAGTLTPHRPYDLQINVEEAAKPIHGPIYSLSPLELAALREFLEEHTRNGFIRPSKSPWGSPILFIKKKDGSLHLCVDFRALNRVTEKDHYPLPLISDLLTSPAPARIYSKIDLKHAYHLVCIAKGDEPKTAFRTCYGSYKWRVMPLDSPMCQRPSRGSSMRYLEI